MDGKHYKLSTLPLFEDDLNEIVDYLCIRLQNPIAAEDFVAAVEIPIRTTQIFHPLLAVISNRQNRRKALKSLGLLRNQNHPKLSSFIRCYP